MHSVLKNWKTLQAPANRWVTLRGVLLRGGRVHGNFSEILVLSSKSIVSSNLSMNLHKKACWRRFVHSLLMVGYSEGSKGRARYFLITGNHLRGCCARILWLVIALQLSTRITLVFVDPCRQHILVQIGPLYECTARLPWLHHGSGDRFRYFVIAACVLAHYIILITQRY